MYVYMYVYKKKSSAWCTNKKGVSFVQYCRHKHAQTCMRHKHAQTCMNCVGWEQEVWKEAWCGTATRCNAGQHTATCV